MDPLSSFFPLSSSFVDGSIRKFKTLLSTNAISLFWNTMRITSWLKLNILLTAVVGRVGSFTLLPPRSSTSRPSSNPIDIGILGEENHANGFSKSACFILKDSSSSSSDERDPNGSSVDVNDTTDTMTPSPRFLEISIPGPPMETKPDYPNIVGPLGRFMDRIFMRVFRRQLARQVGKDSNKSLDDFTGIVDLAATLNREIPDRNEIHRRAQVVLRNLFPSWMPVSSRYCSVEFECWVGLDLYHLSIVNICIACGSFVRSHLNSCNFQRAYTVLFSKPFPAFSSRMNAWATYVAGTWLMGECEINNVEVDGGKMGIDQGLLVKRCRFLEESGCASVCVNSCKIPTQQFFIEDMGLPLTMEPNYETFECQFSFGKTPTVDTEMVAMATPCLQRCPTAGSLRKFHEVSKDAACPYMDK